MENDLKDGEWRFQQNTTRLAISVLQRTILFCSSEKLHPTALKMALLLVVDQLWSVMGPVSIGHILVVSGGMAATETFDQVTTDHVPLSAVVMLQCIKPWCESQTIC